MAALEHGRDAARAGEAWLKLTPTKLHSPQRQWCDALQAPNAPNIKATSNPPPQQTITGRKTASTARPVSVSWARARPMQLQTSAQTPAIMPPQTGIICKGPVEP